MKKIQLCLILFFLTFCGNAQLLINEYSCSNINTVTDAFGEYSDWVELFNNGATATNITGYYLSDDPSDLMKWQIPAAPPINPNGRSMVFCSGRGLVSGTQLHPDFKLTQTKGEWFILSNSAGVIVDSIHLKLTQRGHSRGRTTDGAATWSLFTTPSPNSTNNSSTPYTGYATKPIFSVAPGFYTTTQNVSLSSPDPGVTIRYTLDGTTPTATSPAFTTPIAVAVTSAIRARAFSPSATVAPSFVETNTYLINENTTFNVISVTGPFTTTLFGWASTPITCSYEFFDQNKNFILEYEGRAQRHGHDSWAYPQKGFKVYAQDEYGYESTMEHKYFRTSLRDEFDMVILKAGASDNYAGGPAKSAHMRDMFAHTLAEKYNLEMDYRRYEPTIVFVNGQYWGVYEIRERVDKDFFSYYYGQKEKNVDNLRYWGGLNASPGSPAGWNALVNFIFNNSMSNPANYQTVKDSLNVKSFAQYFIFNQYLVNTDWLNWNTHWWHGRGSSGVKWRYALWDEDNILDLGQNYTGVGSTSYNNDPCDPIGLFPGSTSVPHTTMLDSLLKNPEFKQMYDQQWLDMLNGCFNCQNTLAHFDSLYTLLLPEMPRQITRWPGGSMTDWQSNIAYMRNQIAMRCAVIGGKIDTCLGLNPQELTLNVVPANSGTISLDGTPQSPYVWKKIIKGDSTYTLKATTNAGPYWSFDHWEKFEATNSISPAIDSSLVTLGFVKKDSVVAHFKYFNYDSVDVTFDVTPPGKGIISINGTAIPTYPTTMTLDRRFPYTIQATPTPDYRFTIWQKNNPNTTFSPSEMAQTTTFNYLDKETIVAEFIYQPNNPLSPTPSPTPPPPPIPNLNGVINTSGGFTTAFSPNGNGPNEQGGYATAFSPNGDGVNDVFKFNPGKDAVGMEMSIFNRWGQPVYKNTNANSGWNGNYDNGNAADIGIYQYFIRVRYRNNTVKDFIGELTLIR